MAITADGLTGCSSNGTGDLGKGSLVSEKTIEQVLREKTDQWMTVPGVEGTAIGLFREQPCIKILSSVSARELQAQIPSTVEGYRVVIEETGTFRAMEDQ